MESAPPRRPMLVALIVACAMFMEQLDGTVISTALPSMARSLGTSAVRLDIAITSYMLSLAVFIPVSGWIADRYGAKHVFRAAIGVFTLGSVLCGLSGSLLALTLARILQGVGGALMVPVGRLVLLRSVEKREMVRAMAYLMTPSMLGPILGPPVGGFITTYASWRWIFFLNVPVGLIGLVLVSIFIENAREEQRRPLDLVGFILSGAALTCLLFGLDLVGRMPAEAAGWELMATGGSIGIGAVFHARHHPVPLLDLTLFRIPTFAVSVFGGALVRLAVGALPFLLPLMFQICFGMSAFASGLLTLASALGSMSMKASAGPVLRRYGFRGVLTLNGVISAMSVLACALFGPGTSSVTIFCVLLAGGFFRSLQFTSLNVIAYADIPTTRMSAATSLYSMAQQVTIGAGVALGALLLHIGEAVRGGTGDAPIPSDFHLAFAVVGAASFVAILQFAGLSPHAGAEVSGHRLPAPGSPS